MTSHAPFHVVFPLALRILCGCCLRQALQRASGAPMDHITIRQASKGSRRMLHSDYSSQEPGIGKNWKVSRRVIYSQFVPSGIPGRIPVVHIKSQMTHCHVIAVLNPAVQLNMRVREASLFGGLWLWFCFWNYMHHMADLMLVPLTPAIPVLPGPTVLGALTVCSLL